MRDEPQRVVRGKANSWFVAPLMAVIATIVVYPLFELEVHYGPLVEVPGRGLAHGLSLWVVWCFCWRPHLVFSHSSLIVVNPYSRWILPWDSIEWVDRGIGINLRCETPGGLVDLGVEAFSITPAHGIASLFGAKRQVSRVADLIEGHAEAARRKNLPERPVIHESEVDLKSLGAAIVAALIISVVAWFAF